MRKVKHLVERTYNFSLGRLSSWALNSAVGKVNHDHVALFEMHLIALKRSLLYELPYISGEKPCNYKILVIELIKCK